MIVMFLPFAFCNIVKKYYICNVPSMLLCYKNYSLYRWNLYNMLKVHQNNKSYENVFWFRFFSE